MKDFHINTEIFFGENALDRLSALRFDSALIISDPFVVTSGMITLLTTRLDKAHIRYELFTDVVPDPPVEKVIAGLAAVMKTKPPCLFGVGGGSAIDTAKAIKKFARQFDEDYTPHLIAIPTTSGTGSEVTRFAVISNPSEGRKYPLVDEELLPDEAILDEVLVKSVPASVTADTGMDVMTHAIEAYVSTENNEFSGALAEQAVEITGQFLIRSYISCDDNHARRNIHIASCLAGLAFNSASLGLNHGMAHQLGARFHIPHGRANAILLPYIIEFNSGVALISRSQKEYPSCVRKYCNLARILGVSNMNEVTTIRALISYLHFLNAEMGIPAKVSEACPKLTETEYLAALDDMATAALADGCTATNPRTPSHEEVVEIFKKIW